MMMMMMIMMRMMMMTAIFSVLRGSSGRAPPAAAPPLRMCRAGDHTLYQKANSDTHSFALHADSLFFPAIIFSCGCD